MNSKVNETLHAALLSPRNARILGEQLYRETGEDLRGYRLPWLQRGIRTICGTSGLGKGMDPRELTRYLAEDNEALSRFLASVCRENGLFEDPSLFASLRRDVLPYLRTWPFIRIWLAGCNTGLEICSLAVILTEEGLGGRSLIYGTDLHEPLVRIARRPKFPAERWQLVSRRYLRAGGKGRLADWFVLRGGWAFPDPALLRNVSFGTHHSTEGASLNEFNFILCRNFLSRHSASARERVHHLIHGSLTMFGFLALGPRERLSGSPFSSRYQSVDGTGSIFRKAS